MEYFVKGISHFFNLFADFLEHCENIIYFLLLVILLVLIFFTLKKDSKFKKTICDLIKSYLAIFKFLLFTILCIILLLSSIITFKMNNQFKILSLVVVVINFIKETVTLYDDNILKEDRIYILKKSDLKNILIPNLILIFFKITYWCEFYIFDIHEIKTYFIIMLLVIILQILVVVMFKIYSIYGQAFKFIKSGSNYNFWFKVIALIKILKLCSNKVNYFRLVKIFLSHEIITKKNHNEIINLCLYYKAIKNKIIIDGTYLHNFEIYNDFKNINDRIGCDKNE